MTTLLHEQSHSQRVRAFSLKPCPQAHLCTNSLLMGKPGDEANAHSCYYANNEYMIIKYH